MRLTVLGCAGSYASATSACSSYLLEAEGFRLLLDCGSGAVGALQAHGELYGVDAVVITHLHPDHCIDLAAYAVARRYHPDGPRPAVPLHAPAGTVERIATAYGAPGDGLEDVYRASLLEAGTRTVGPFTVTAARSNHPIECYMLRFEAGGRSLTYSADTGVSDALVTLARDTDLLLCEASFVETSPHAQDVHLTGAEAGDHATRAGARRLVLTHLVAWFDPAQVLDEAMSTWSGAVELARPGATYQL